MAVAGTAARARTASPSGPVDPGTGSDADQLDRICGYCLGFAPRLLGGGGHLTAGSLPGSPGGLPAEWGLVPNDPKLDATVSSRHEAGAPLAMRTGLFRMVSSPG